MRIVKLFALLSTSLFLVWFGLLYRDTSRILDGVYSKAYDYVEFNHEALGLSESEIYGYAEAMAQETIKRYSVERLENLPVADYYLPRRAPHHRGGGDE